MSQGCRDCTRCTESCLTTLIMLPFRIIFSPLTLLLRTTQRKCPRCGHPIAMHAKDKQGRFKD